MKEISAEPLDFNSDDSTTLGAQNFSLCFVMEEFSTVLKKKKKLLTISRGTVHAQEGV